MLSLALAPVAIAQERSDAMVAVSLVSKDGGQLEAGRPVHLTVKARDPVSGYPLTGLSPAVWMVPDTGEDASCEAWVNRLAGSPVPPPGVDDLNGYDIVQLARDGALALIDPRLNLASANIRSLIRLGSLPALWSIDPGGSTLAIVPGNARSKMQLFGHSPLALRREIDVGAEIVSLNAGDREILAGTADGRLLRILPGGELESQVTLGTGPVLLQQRDDGGLVALAQDGQGLIEGDGGKSVRFSGIKGGARSVSYSSLADSVYVLAGDGRSLSMLHRDHSARLFTIPIEVEAARIVPDRLGKWLALPAVDGRSVAIFDTRIGRLRWTIGTADPVRDVLFSDSFLYFTHARAGGVTRVVFDPDGDAPGVATIAAGEASASDRAPSPMPLVVRVPGNGIIAASPDRRIGFMVAEDGAQAAMSSVPLLAGDTAGLLLRYRGLREVGRDGEYRTEFVPEHGGRYLAVVRIDQPQLAHCSKVMITGADDPALAMQAGTTLQARITLRLLAAPKIGDTDVRFAIDNGPPGAFIRNAILIAAAGGWHRLVAVTTEGDGRYRFRTKIPGPGLYRFYADVGKPDGGNTLALDVPVPR